MKGSLGAAHIPLPSCRERRRKCKADFRIDRGQERDDHDVRKSWAPNELGQALQATGNRAGLVSTCARRVIVRLGPASNSPSDPPTPGFFVKAYTADGRSIPIPFGCYGRAISARLATRIGGMTCPASSHTSTERGRSFSPFASTVYLTRCIHAVDTKTPVTASCRSAPPG